jgi:large subunit ribosomal protein L29
MKAKEIRESSVEELEVRQRELADQLFNLRLQKVVGQLEKPSKVREVKRDMARVLTVLNERKTK